MTRVKEIEEQQQAMHTLADLTNVFEGLASMRIAQIKNEVQKAQEFFNELWQIYLQLCVRASLLVDWCRTWGLLSGTLCLGYSRF